MNSTGATFQILQFTVLLCIAKTTWSAAKLQVIQLILQEERATHPQLKAEEIEVWKENKLPVIDVRIDNFSTIKLLRSNKFIRYVEPMSYEPENFDEAMHAQLENIFGAGCGNYSSETNLQEGDDYTNILPGAKQSWKLIRALVPARII